MDDPAEFVRAYLADHLGWNQAAYAREPKGRCRDEVRMAADEVSKAEYAKLLAKYCRPGFVGQPITYGIPPLHDPACETVVSVTPRGRRCVVKTRSTLLLAGVELVTDFEYWLSRGDDRWYLDGVKYVDGAGRHECL